ncbi:MAG TPA: DUF5674 family protein [Gemmatimonadales bacterium]|jgi:hypothetical protein
MPIRIVRSATSRNDLASLAAEQFGDMVKAVVDAERGETWIEFDSVINIRPSQGNRSRNVDDAGVRGAIREIVTALVRE